MIHERLGPYEITGQLGAGGMGDVWRAVDTRLGREVALKLLPEDFAVDAERHARFEREAKTLAALNHPNIATLYGLEHLGERHALAMELVEGETLDGRLGRGPIPVDEAVPIALQIAEALEAAHEKGIVHRDLKPANVMVRPDGTVKVLDFGLAKAWEEEIGEGSLSLSPTITQHHTKAGVILGTAPYMSPEQAKGRSVDRRADVWAFGVVVWEMLTGRRLFAGDSVTEALASVLTTEVDFAGLPAALPREVRRVLRRCLERDPRRRLHAIADARIVLEDVVAGRLVSDDEPAAIGADSRMPSGRRLLLVATAVAVAVAASGLFGWVLGQQRGSRSEPVHLSVVLPANQEIATESDSTLAFAPDGKSLVLTAVTNGRPMLFSRRLDEATVTPIAGTDGGQTPFFSPDGRWLGFVARGKLMKVPVEGGRPFELGDMRGAGGAAWLGDDTLIFAPIYSDGLFRMSADGGEPERLTAPDRSSGELGHWWPDPLPGQRRVIFTAFRTPVDRSRIGVLDLATLEVRWAVDGGFCGRYIAGGYLVYAKGQRLYAAPFDPGTGTVTGQSAAVVDDVRVSQVSGTAMAAVSSRGTLAYVAESVGNPMRELVWLDRNGLMRPASAERRRYLSVSLSPDDDRAALTIQGESRDLWTYSLERGTLSRLTSGPKTEFAPTWSADASELFYVVDSPPFELHRMAASAADAGRRLWDEPTELDTTGIAVAPDGRWMAFVRTEAETGANLYVRPIDGSEPPRPFRVTRADEQYATFSPDGRWLAYQSDETGRPEIYVEAFPGPGRRFQISADGGTEPVWARASGELFFRHFDEFRVVATRLGEDFDFDAPRTLFSSRITKGGIENARYWDVTADGLRILAVNTPDAEVPRQIELVTDWVAGLSSKTSEGRR